MVWLPAFFSTSFKGDTSCCTLHSVRGRSFFIPSYLTEASCCIVMPVEARRSNSAASGSVSETVHGAGLAGARSLYGHGSGGADGMRGHRVGVRDFGAVHAGPRSLWI